VNQFLTEIIMVDKDNGLEIIVKNNAMKNTIIHHTRMLQSRARILADTNLQTKNTGSMSPQISTVPATH
jgi:hypothetical protein